MGERKEGGREGMLETGFGKKAESLSYEEVGA